MESTIAEDFLNDLAELSDEDLPQKKQKIAIEPLESSKLLSSPSLSQILSNLKESDISKSNSFVEQCNNMIVEIDLE